MALTLSFFIKHIRPIDEAAVNIILGIDEVREFFEQALNDMEEVANLWMGYIVKYNEMGGPEILAQMAYEGRAELRHVPRETVLFLSGAQLDILLTQSEANNRPNDQWIIDFGDLVEARTAGDDGYMGNANNNRFNLGNDRDGDVNHLEA